MLRKLTAAGAALAILAAATPALAQNARCQVRSIHARPVEGGVDAALEDLKPKLTRPPFVTWKTFKLLSSEQLQLAPGAASKFSLPEGREGTLTYKDHIKGEGGKHRVRLQLEVKKGGQPQLSTVMVLDEGGTVLNAGLKHGDGILILGVSCVTGS